MENILQCSSEDMAGINFQCICGKVHGVDIKKVKIGNEVLSDLVRSLALFKDKKILFVADDNTYEVSGKKVASLLSETFTLEEIIFRNPHLTPDEAALQRLRVGVVKGDIAVIVVVGSGTLNDLARLSALQKRSLIL